MRINGLFGKGFVTGFLLLPFLLLFPPLVSAVAIFSDSFEAPSPSLEPNQAILGPLAGAEIRAFRLTDLSNPVEGPIIADVSHDDLSQAGTFRLTLAGIPAGEWILVTASGGEDIDVNDGGVVDDTPTPNLGTLHALAKAGDWRAGGKTVNVLTEIAWQQVASQLQGNTLDTLEGTLQWIAVQLLRGDIDGNDVIDYRDMLSYQPYSTEHQASLTFYYGDFQFEVTDTGESLISALRKGDETAVRAAIAILFGNQFELPQPLKLVDIEPQLTLPANPQGITEADVNVRNFLSDTAQVSESTSTLLIAEDDQGHTLLLGYTIPQQAQSQAARFLTTRAAVLSELAIVANETEPEISPRSTALALIMLIAGMGANVADQAVLAAAAMAHSDFESLVADLESEFNANAYFLDTLLGNELLSEKIKLIGKQIFDDYLAQLEAEQSGAAITALHAATPERVAPRTAEEHTFWRKSPWKPGEPWLWYGSATAFDVWNPPFIAISTKDKNLVASANPAMVNYAISFYDINGQSVAKWQVAPRNSTAIQKSLNSFAARGNFPLKIYIPETTEQIEFQKFFIYSFPLNEPKGYVLFIFNTMHLGLALVNVVLEFPELLDGFSLLTKNEAAIEVLKSCAPAIINTVDFPAIDGDKSASEWLGEFIESNDYSLFETIFNSCALPAVKVAIQETISFEDAIKKSLSGLQNLFLKLSGPLGWAKLIFDGVNELAPLATSLLSWKNEAIEYKLIWDTDHKQILDVIPLQINPEILVNPTAVSVPEGGSATVQVTLSQAPASEVNITTTRTSGDSDLDVQSVFPGLIFTSRNWNIKQSITLAATEDADQIDGTATFTLSASGLSDVTVTATESDNDIPAPTQGLVAYYPFDGDTQDASGNDHHGTAHGVVPTTDFAGNPDSAYSFYGMDDHISVEHADALNLGEEFTIAFWMQLSDWSCEGGWIISKHRAFDNINFWQLGIDCPTPGQLFFYSIDSENQKSSGWLVSDLKIEPNKVYHVAFTNSVNKGKSYFYITDEEGNVHIDEFDSANAPGANTYPMWIGAHYGISHRQIDGVLDEIRIYNRALSATEVAKLAADANRGLIAHFPLDGDGTDTIGGYVANPNGNVDYVAGKNGQAVKLDGNSGLDPRFGQQGSCCIATELQKRSKNF